MAGSADTDDIVSENSPSMAKMLGKSLNSYMNTFAIAVSAFTIAAAAHKSYEEKKCGRP